MWVDLCPVSSAVPSWVHEGEEGVKLRLFWKQGLVGKRCRAFPVTCAQTVSMEVIFFFHAPAWMFRAWLCETVQGGFIQTLWLFGLLLSQWVKFTRDMVQMLCIYVLQLKFLLIIRFSIWLSMVLFNARSLTSKSYLLNNFIVSKKLDFLFLTETWQQDSDSSSLIEFCRDGYSFISQPQAPSQERGLAAVFWRRFSCRSAKDSFLNLNYSW